MSNRSQSMSRGFLIFLCLLGLGVGLGYWVSGSAVSDWLANLSPRLIYLGGLSLLIVLPVCGWLLLQGYHLVDLEENSKKVAREELGGLLVALIIFMGINLLTGLDAAFLLKSSQALVFVGGVGTLDMGLLLLTSVLADLLWRH